MPTNWIINKETGERLPVYYETLSVYDRNHNNNPPAAWACTYCMTGGLEESGHAARGFAVHHAAITHNYPRRCTWIQADGIPCAHAAVGNGPYCRSHYEIVRDRKLKGRTE